MIAPEAKVLSCIPHGTTSEWSCIQRLFSLKQLVTLELAEERMMADTTEANSEYFFTPEKLGKFKEQLHA